MAAGARTGSPLFDGQGIDRQASPVAFGDIVADLFIVDAEFENRDIVGYRPHHVRKHGVTFHGFRTVAEQQVRPAVFLRDNICRQKNLINSLQTFGPNPLLKRRHGVVGPLSRRAAPADTGLLKVARSPAL
jgi:hypothetical protein